VISKAHLGGAGAWALILAAFSAGNFIGGLAVLRFRPRRPLLVGCSLLLPVAAPLALLAVRAPALAIAAVALLAGPTPQTRVASITLKGECVGMARSSRKPAAWKRR
jgi:uncharacterized membrane protein YoaK (UPF0700 family)